MNPLEMTGLNQWLLLEASLERYSKSRFYNLHSGGGGVGVGGGRCSVTGSTEALEHWNESVLIQTAHPCP